MDAPPPKISKEYMAMVGCESDDSQDSNTSRSDDNEGLPGIIYTSDDSADVGQSDSTYADSDVPNYIAQDVNQLTDDHLSDRFLLESGRASPQPSPQNEILFMPHPLASRTFKIEDCPLTSPKKDFVKNTIFVDKSHLQVHNDDDASLRRSTSLSSTETESAPERDFLARYEPLPLYADDETYTGGMHFDVLQEDPVKTKFIQEHLNLMNTGKDAIQPIEDDGMRCFVGDVHIESKCADLFFVKWNWNRIRKSCVFVNLSLLIGLLCASIGMLIQMPQGSECNPVQEWWQGMASYHIYVPSFQDSNGDGIGDIRGLVQRLDYIEWLGVKTVRLCPIFEGSNYLDLPLSYSPENYTTVYRTIGEVTDIQLLASLLHERDMFLVLDVPLVRKGFIGQEDIDLSQPKPTVDLVTDVPSFLSFWLRLGVDGFAFTDLDELALEKNLVDAVQLWRDAADARMRSIHRKVLMVPINLLEKMESSKAEDLTHLLRVVDMVDVHLDVESDPMEVVANIDAATRWDSSPSFPWIHWTVGGMDRERLWNLDPANSWKTLSATQTDNWLSKNSHKKMNYNLDKPFTSQPQFDLSWLSPLMLQLFLPGSVSFYFGDEIGLRQVQEGFPSWVSPMQWVGISAGNPYGGFSSVEPWAPLLKEVFPSVLTLTDNIEPLRTMIAASQKEVPLYINGIFQYEGDYLPRKSSNYEVRLASDGLLVLDRFYPRRNKLSIVMNLGNNTLHKDLSLLYYGGKVLASTHGKEGYVHFRNIELKPREALMCLLDK